MLPVLNSIPPDLKDFNLTMGYPLKLTPVFSLLDALFLLFINAGRYAEKKIIPDGKVSISPRFHYRDIKRFLGHPYLGTAPFPGDPPGRKQKEKLNKSFYKADELFRLLNTAQPGLSEVFREDDSAAGFSPGYLAGLMQALITFFRDRFVADDAASGKEVHRIDIEYLYHFALLLKRIQLLTAETDLVDKSETLYEIFTGLVTGMRLPFYGEPLKGLQIMGMLETRTLDFRNIIMLSVNEGLLPKGKHQNTFIPDEVRKEFGLQLYNERNAVFAYHFYRLLQRSSSIHLLYNTEGNDLGGGEMSRFISQIRLELPSYNPKIHISGRLLSVPAMQLSDAAVSIAKDEAVLERLGELAEKGFSPTGLSRYLACSLQFCYAQVLKITEPEQLDETIDAATLGEVVHAVLYQSYKPFLGQKVTPSELESILPSAIAGVKAEFSSRYPVSELESGKNLLIVKVAENMIKRFLLAESAYLEKLPAGQQSAEILNLESGLEAMIRVPDLATGELREVKIKGQADRIDKVDGKLRVIDYKTGRLDDAEVKLDSVKLLREHKNPAKLLQLLTYAWMYTRMNPGQQANELVSGIISLRMSSRYLMNARIGTEDKLSNSQLSDFETLLSDVLSEIFNPDIPFIRTEHTENCRYCAYQSLCNRVVN